MTFPPCSARNRVYLRRFSCFLWRHLLTWVKIIAFHQGDWVEQTPFYAWERNRDLELSELERNIAITVFHFSFALTILFYFLGGGNICGQSKTCIFYPLCADMEIWLGQGGDFIRSPRFQWWRWHCSGCLWNIPISSLIFQTLAKQCYPQIRKAEVILSIGLLSRLLKGKVFCRYLSLRVEHPFWDIWLWNSGDNYLVLLLCWFSKENVGRVGLWNHAFWCELGNFILRECRSYLNFVCFN